MSTVSVACYVLGSFLYANSAYSMYQINQLANLTGAQTDTIQIDLVVEVILASVLFLAGALVSTNDKKNRDLGPLATVPEQAAKQLTGSPLKEILIEKANDENEIQGFTQFDRIDYRLSYTNWRAKRAEYQKWRKAE